MLCSIPRWNTVRSSRCSPLHYANHQAPPIPCAFPAVKPHRVGKPLLRSKAFTLAFTMGKHLLASPSHPRQGVPTTVEAFVLCAAMQQPLSFRDGTRLVPRCVPRSINAASIAFPVLQASSAVSTSCLSRQPHKACCCHSPLRSLTGVANANELPQLLLRSAT